MGMVSGKHNAWAIPTYTVPRKMKRMREKSFLNQTAASLFIWNMYIFYCDDDEDDLDLFKKAVHKINSKINCVTSNDAEEALSFLSTDKKKPHAIFVDVHMPKLDGIEFVIAIKRNSTLKRIPIIVISNGLGKHEVEQFNRLGVFRFVLKTTYQDLESSLKSLLYADDVVKE